MFKRQGDGTFVYHADPLVREGQIPLGKVVYGLFLENGYLFKQINISLTKQSDKLNKAEVQNTGSSLEIEIPEFLIPKELVDFKTRKEPIS